VLNTGSMLVSVHGTGLGMGAYTAASRVGQSRCEVTNWQSETSVRCGAAQGIQKSRRAALTVGEQGGSLTQVLSFDLAGLSILGRQNAPGTGSASLTVHGARMGTLRYSTMSRGGHTTCESTEWQSETSVRCGTAAGLTGTRRVVMTVGEQKGSVSQGWSVESLGLSSMRVKNLAGTGSAFVTVYGTGMSVASHTGKVRGGYTGYEATGWTSETSLRCRIGHTSGRTRRVGLTLSGLGGSMSQAWSTDLDGVSISRRSNRAGTGAGSFTVHGSSFGDSFYSSKVRSSFTGCETTQWESSTSMRCLVA
jgi:hypothetical protein